MISSNSGGLRRLLPVGVLLLLVAVMAPGVAVSADSAGWQEEFADLSLPAAQAMDLPVGQLQSLLTRCEELKVKIQLLDETERKVYGKRLQMTCDLYRFMLDSKLAAEEGKGQP